MADVASAYLTEALDLIESKSLRRELDWTALRELAFRLARGASEPRDCHAAIEAVLERVDRHSRLRLPSRAEDRALKAPSELPSAHRLEHAAALRLPSLPVVGPAALEYAVAAHRALRDIGGDEIQRWIVDLRANDGGNLWPMVVAAGPLLGVGPAGTFVSADGRIDEWGYQPGRAIFRGAVLAEIAEPCVLAHLPAVAVLTSGITKSAGEGVTIAFRGRERSRTFGAATNGVPTANQVIRLSDGAVLVLTVSWMADRTGRRYDEPLMPDVLLGDNALVEAAAVAWLREVVPS